METVSKTGMFGNSFFEIKGRTVPKGGLYVKKPFGGDFIIYDELDGLIHDSSEFSNGIVAFKKKSISNDIRIVFVNTSSVRCQDCASVYAFDDGDSVEWKIPYDIDLVYSDGRAQQFVEFILGKNLLNGLADKVFEKLKPCVDAVVTEVIGKRNRDAVEQINTDKAKLAEEILSTLNSVGGLYDFGFTATKFCFNVTDDYMHRLLKIRIQEDKRI